MAFSDTSSSFSKRPRIRELLPSAEDAVSFLPCQTGPKQCRLGPSPPQRSGPWRSQPADGPAFGP